MEKFRELSFEEMVEVEGGILNPKKLWDLAKLGYEALQIQDAINQFVDGWNSVDCDCKK